MPAIVNPSALDTWLDRWFRWLLLVGLLLNLSGLTLTLMEPDATLYGTIARNMAESGDFVDLIADGGDWLDKPHFPFWLTALSFRLLGVNEVAYKLPGLLFWGLGLVYTYLFARHFYSRSVARLAVLFLLTAQHLVMSNNDVRAEPYLVGLIIGAVYHYVRAGEHRFSHHLIWGSLLAACAMMTKGPFVLLTVGGGLVVHWVMHRQWSELWHPRWWVALLLVGVFILPELYCLYQQFDLHPEKVVFGRTGVSGVRFFFWDSQFGRFFNTGPIRGKGNPFFFLHTVLWAFLPWSLWLYGAVLGGLAGWRKRTGEAREYVTWGAAGLSFLVFSLSRFQLPHYLNILFPFFSIIIAGWVCQPRDESRLRWVAGVQWLATVAMMLLAPFLLWLARPQQLVPALLWCVLALGLSLWIFRGRGLPELVGRSFGASVAFNILLNVFLYPELLLYQGGSEAAFFVNAQPPRTVGTYGDKSYAFELYSHAPVHRWDLAALKEAASTRPVYLYVARERVAELEQAGLSVSPLRTFDQFRVTRLTGRFLNPATRPGVVRPMLVAEVGVAPSSQEAHAAEAN
ncbi:glycosyltransferase family 39 protein [Archangium violaceum]|uniref:ArnT family glycosyltransferase n=1 Tax=Archangium violaceum TaxID=83451 RepID=UPI00193B714C|nr:glycosyltransferase family 39 protein [Archangium violaceum]QRK08220.1 glycosyltransferase family 39 protein [Archangium violaceum]